MTGKGETILVAGRVYCDLLFLGLDAFPQLGRESFARDMAVSAGGGAFITSAHLASLGRPVALVSHLGTDPFSGLIGEMLDRSGIDQSWLVRVDRPLPRVTAAIVDNGDRAFVTRSASAPGDRAWQAALTGSGAGWLHIPDANTLEDFPRLLDGASEAGLRVTFDCGWHTAFLESDAVWEILPKTAVFLPNGAEATALCGEEETADGIERSARRLAGAGPLVIVKDGPRPVVACDGGRIVRRVPPRVDAVDATGAGDAFNAGILYGLSAGWPLERALALATALGAWTVQRPGGAAETPSWAALEALGAPPAEAVSA